MQAPNPNKSLFISLFFAVLIMILLASCGARKTQTTKVDSDISKTETTEKNTNVVETKTIDSSANEATETTTYTPIDFTKPSQVNAIIFTNTIIQTQKKVATIVKKLEARKADLSKQITKSKAVEKVDSKTKAIDKKAFNPLQLLWLLIPLFLLYILYGYRYKILSYFVR